LLWVTLAPSQRVPFRHLLSALFVEDVLEDHPHFLWHLSQQAARVELNTMVERDLKELGSLLIVAGLNGDAGEGGGPVFGLFFCADPGQGFIEIGVCLQAFEGTLGVISNPEFSFLTLEVCGEHFLIDHVFTE